MRITKSQLRRIIKEHILSENIVTLVKKYATAEKSIDDAVEAALRDNPEIDRQTLEDAMEDYYDEMMMGI